MIFARGLAEIANRSAPARFGAFSLLPRVWLRISDELPRPVEVAASVAERLARVVLRQARELGEEDIARARRFRLGHGRSGLLLRRQKRLARWASHAGPVTLAAPSVLGEADAAAGALAGVEAASVPEGILAALPRTWAPPTACVMSWNPRDMLL